MGVFFVVLVCDKLVFAFLFLLGKRCFCSILFCWFSFALPWLCFIDVLWKKWFVGLFVISF